MNARPIHPVRAVAIAALVAGLALGAACTAGAVLRARAAATSHELPPAAPAPTLGAAERSALVDRGRALFTGSCSHCHGLDARGDEGPDLHGVQMSDRHLARVIRDGIRGEMPSFAKKHDANDVAALIAFLRSLE
jgi:mono/diheme cytochrome c family protein